ncbi:histone-lysine N-methyltransferase 2D-like [Latimeria chalumnae]|uniref:histone-lysine N-methyltransferase 2D-like n=1 Tax=Latimeria chalumnae TaxID=7897 RepID=UPI00313EE4E7
MEAAKKKAPGFRHCDKCSSPYPSSDKHHLCLKCLGPGHLPRDCKLCQSMGSRALKRRVLQHRELFPQPPLSPTPWSSGSRGVAKSDPTDPAPGVPWSSADLETVRRSELASKASRKSSSKRSAPVSDASASVSGAASVPWSRDVPEAPAPTGSRAASAVLDSESEPEARPETEPPCTPPQTPRGSPRQEDPAWSEPTRRHRHGSRQHRHHSRHRSDPLLGGFLEAIMVCLESLEALSRAPPESTLPALSSLEPLSLAPASPSQALMSELLAPTSDPVLLVPVPDPDALGPSSRPTTSWVAARSSDPILAVPPCAGPRRVSFPHAASVEGDSGEAWCEAEGMQSGEVSAAFYTSTSTDSEQGGSAELPAQDASFHGLIEKMAGVLTLELSSASEADRSRFMQVLQGRSVRSRLQVPRTMSPPP